MSNAYLNNLIKQNLSSNLGSGLNNSIFKDYSLYQRNPVSTGTSGVLPNASLVKSTPTSATPPPSSWWGNLGSSISDKFSNATLPELMDAANITTSIYSNFFGDDKDIFNLNKKLLNQNIANNEYNMAHKKEFDTALLQGSNEALKNLKPQTTTKVG